MSLIYKKQSIKNLTLGKKRIDGRNNKGKITIYHRGGGCKRSYRLIDFKRSVWNVFGIVSRIEYDPNRNAFISLIVYANGIMCYNICAESIKVGDTVITSLKSFLKVGNSLISSNVPNGTRVCCVERSFSKGAQYVRSAGAYATVVSKFNQITTIKLKSGKFINIHSKNLITIGTVSNFKFSFRNFKKASYYRLKGWRPTVRGVAMNPIDHPHGGGQGKTSGGRPSVTPWGVITKGKPTRKR